MAQLDGRCTYVGLAQAQHGPMGIRPLPAWPDEGVMPRPLLWFTMQAVLVEACEGPSQ